MTFKSGASTSDLDIHLRKLQRRGIQISPDRAVRVYRLAAQLIVEGAYPDSKKELGQWVTPLLANDAASQRKIRDYFDGDLKIQSEVKDQFKDDPPEGETPRNWPIISFFVLAIVAIFVFLAVTDNGTSILPGGSAGDTGNTQNQNTELTSSGSGSGLIESIMAFFTGSVFGYVTQIGSFRLLVSLFIGVCMAALVYWRNPPYEKRNRVLDSQARETSDIAAALGAAAAKPQSGGEHGAIQQRSFAGYRRRYAVESNLSTTTKLRLRRDVDSNKFDERATVRKAEKAFGRIVELVPRKRSLSISLLLLIDRHGRSDHLGALGDLMAERLLDNDVAFEAFEFRGDATTLLPRGLRHEANTQNTRPLIELLQESQIGPAIIVSDGADLIDPISGQLRPWIEMLNGARPTVLFTPKKPADWGRRERLLLQAGIRIYPTFGDGLENFTQDLVDFYESEITPKEIRTNPRARPWSVPERYVYGEDPGAEKRDALLFELNSRLSPRAFKLLCALGMAPMVGPDLTLLLGHFARQNNGLTGWVDDGVLSELAQLPWLREGYFPKWLRQELVLQMGKKSFAVSKQAIRAFYDTRSGQISNVSDGQSVDVLGKGGTAQGGPAVKPHRKRDVLFESIMRAEDIDALMTLLSHDPETLAKEEQRRRWHEFFRRFYVGAAMIGGAAAVFTMWPLILTMFFALGSLISRIVDPSNYNTLLFIHHGLLLISLLAIIAGIQLAKLYDEIGARPMQGIKNRRKLGKGLHIGALGVLGFLAVSDISILYSFSNRPVDQVAGYAAQSVLACIIIGLIFLRPSRAPVTWEDVSKARNLPFYFIGATTTAIAIANLLFIVPNNGVVEWPLGEPERPNQSSYLIWYFATIGASVGMLRTTSLKDPGPFLQRRFGELLTARDMAPVWLSVAVIISVGMDVLPFSLTVTKGYSSTISFVDQTMSVGPFVFAGFWALHSTRIGPVSAFLPAVVLAGGRFVEYWVFSNDALVFYFIALPAALVFGVCLVARSANLRGANASLVVLSISTIACMLGVVFAAVLLDAFLPELFGTGSVAQREDVVFELDIQAFYGSVLPFATFIAWLAVMHASARLSVVTEWRGGRGFGYVWLLPLAACLVTFQLADTLTLTLTDVLLPMAAIAGARGGFPGFLCVVLAAVLGTFSFSFGVYTLGGIGAGNAIAAILIAAVFAHKTWALRWLGAVPPTHITWVMLLAAGLMNHSYFFGPMGISVYLFPALCIAGFLIGLGRGNVMPHFFYAILFGSVGLTLRVLGVSAGFGGYSINPAFHFDDGLGVALCILLGRALRVLAFGDVRHPLRGYQFDILFPCAKFIAERPMGVFVAYTVLAFGNPGVEIAFIENGFLKLATPFIVTILAFVAGFQNPKGRDFERSLFVAAISLACMIVAIQFRGPFDFPFGFGFAPLGGIYLDLIIAPALAFFVGFRLRVETYALRALVMAASQPTKTMKSEMAE